jgi:hypothetical protein
MADGSAQLRNQHYILLYICTYIHTYIRKSIIQGDEASYTIRSQSIILVNWYTESCVEFLGRSLPRQSRVITYVLSDRGL